VPDAIEARSIHIAPLAPEHAQDISTWRYDAPYDVYDMVGTDPEELLQPEVGYHAVMAGDRLIGFRSFGPDGQVPGWSYDRSALDTGGGLRPELTGQGLGRAAISAGLAFGRERYAPGAFRVTVASFNIRALRTVQSLGFERVGSFEAARDARNFDVLIKVEGRHQEQTLMGKSFKKDVHESSADTPTPGSVDHADADQLEVSSQPSLSDLRLQHLERVVGPPLAMLARVAGLPHRRVPRPTHPHETAPWPSST
jgi:RimJ/RimL family protein N-acetyltransferase